VTVPPCPACLCVPASVPQVAEILVSGEVEAQDLSDSKLRVQLMQDAIALGNYKAAADYAITHEERRLVEEMVNKPRSVTSPQSLG
jgi:hypothetical protein